MTFFISWSHSDGPINLVLDFSTTGLDLGQRILIARGLKARFVNALLRGSFSEVPSQRFHPFRRTRRKDLRDSATNRLTGPSYAYDASGNLTLLDGVTYAYDPMHLTTTRNGDGTEWAAIYTADDERLAVWDTAKGTVQETWTLRGLDGLVLREYFFGVGLSGELIFADGFEDHPVEEPLCAWRLWDGTQPTCSGTGPGNPTWSVRGTYVYRNGALLADVNGATTRHYHLDHLGSVRQITDDEGVVAETHDYLPYGTEVPGSSAGLRFTGHERDGHLAGGGDDLDYMHARYCSPVLGRFLSVDPVMQLKRAMKMPQLWNRYAYAVGNPLKFTDPTGEAINLVLDFSTTGLDLRQRILIARGLKARFVNAGVKDVRVHFKGGPFKGNDKGGTNATVSLKFVTREVGGERTFGVTPGNPPGNRSEISLARAPSGEGAALNFLINVGSHEAGHGSQALPQFNMDALPVGSFLHPVGAERGSVMETNVPAGTLGAGPREFSASDAKLLQEELNEEPPQ